jgi:XTP/dITP diphosphohydrolase
MINLVLATRNTHKVQELRTLFSDMNINVFALNDIADNVQLREDGKTFEENALQKARIVYQSTKMITLADDSGLEVFYLNRRPGVFSARYAGEPSNDDANNRKLLFEMRGVPRRRRRAQFRSILALVCDQGETLTIGICSGIIAEEPHGTNGFGYDPIFIPDGFSKTYAQLTADQKNLISHRAQSLKKMKEILKVKFPSIQ